MQRLKLTGYYYHPPFVYGFVKKGKEAFLSLLPKNVTFWSSVSYHFRGKIFA